MRIVGVLWLTNPELLKDRAGGRLDIAAQPRNEIVVTFPNLTIK
jgi:hypothetical protein